MSPLAVFKLYDNTDLLELNIKQYLDHIFLLNGMYSNVDLAQQWHTTDRIDTLTRITSTEYQSNFDNWVFEEDVTGPSGYDVISVSGVYVSGIFNPTGSGTYAPHIDYKRGRVIFESGVPTGVTVNANFSYKRANITTPDSEAARIIFSRFRYGQDVASISLPSGSRVQLPIIAISPDIRDINPWQLGGGQKIDQEISFHIVANSRRDINKIVDLLTTKSYRQVISAVDFNLTPEQFDFYGDKADSYQDYSELQASGALAWRKLFILNTTVAEPVKEIFGLYTARIDWGLEFYLPANG